MFLENLTALMKKRGINKSTLAKESGIPYTTIDGFYKKGCDNTKLSTLVRLSEYFGVSLDYLINGEVTNLSEHEKAVLTAYRSHPDMQKAVDTLLGIPADGSTVAEDIAETVNRLSEKSTVSK